MNLEQFIAPAAGLRDFPRGVVHGDKAADGCDPTSRHVRRQDETRLLFAAHLADVPAPRLKSGQSRLPPLNEKNNGFHPAQRLGASLISLPTQPLIHCHDQ